MISWSVSDRYWTTLGDPLILHARCIGRFIFLARDHSDEDESRGLAWIQMKRNAYSYSFPPRRGLSSRQLLRRAFPPSWGLSSSQLRRASGTGELRQTIRDFCMHIIICFCMHIIIIGVDWFECRFAGQYTWEWGRFGGQYTWEWGISWLEIAGRHRALLEYLLFVFCEDAIIFIYGWLPLGESTIIRSSYYLYKSSKLWDHLFLFPINPVIAFILPRTSRELTRTNFRLMMTLGLGLASYCVTVLLLTLGLVSWSWWSWAADFPSDTFADFHKNGK
jgi:hypothetical protein